MQNRHCENRFLVCLKEWSSHLLKNIRITLDVNFQGQWPSFSLILHAVVLRHGCKKTVVCNQCWSNCKRYSSSSKYDFVTFYFIVERSNVWIRMVRIRTQFQAKNFASRVWSIILSFHVGSELQRKSHPPPTFIYLMHAVNKVIRYSSCEGRHGVPIHESKSYYYTKRPFAHMKRTVRGAVWPHGCERVGEIRAHLVVRTQLDLRAIRTQSFGLDAICPTASPTCLFQVPIRSFT